MESTNRKKKKLDKANERRSLENTEALCGLYDQMMNGFNEWTEDEHNYQQSKHNIRYTAVLSLAMCLFSVFITLNAMPVKKYDRIDCKNCNKEIIYGT